jgi:hypothetical protein
MFNIFVKKQKDSEEDENIAIKKNEDGWRLEKYQIGRCRFS